MVAEWRAAEERDRGLGNCFYHLGTEGERRGSRKEKRGNSGRQRGPIGGQSLRVRGSIWKETLCLALYCTPCCFNQWQACSQSLEQQWLFLIVWLLLPLFLLHYTPTLLTKSLKSCAALSGPLWKLEKWMCCGENIYTMREVKRPLFCNDDLIRSCSCLAALL